MICLALQVLNYCYCSFMYEKGKEGNLPVQVFRQWNPKVIKKTKSRHMTDSTIDTNDHLIVD